MFRYYNFRFRFNKWFENPNGIKGFAEQSLAWFIRSAVKKSHIIRSKIEMLHDKKSKLMVRLEELETLPLLNNDEYFGIRKKIRFQQLMIPTIIIIEVFLNYISTLVFINGDGFMFSAIRWGIAFILTFMGVIVADKLLEAISPNKPKNRIRSGIKIDDSTSNNEDNKNKAIIKITLLSILLIMTEIAIIGVSEARARDIEGGSSGGVLYYGFILLSMALPIAAGYLRWDMLVDYDAYKNTLDHFMTRKTLHRIDQKIIELAEKEKFFLKSKAIREWQIFSEFKNYKEVFNKKAKPPIEQEDLSNHFCRDRDTFIETSMSEYNKSVPDINSFTKLEQIDKRVGGKIGQITSVEDSINE